MSRPSTGPVTKYCYSCGSPNHLSPFCPRRRFTYSASNNNKSTQLSKQVNRCAVDDSRYAIVSDQPCSYVCTSHTTRDLACMQPADKAPPLPPPPPQLESRPAQGYHGNSPGQTSTTARTDCSVDTAVALELPPCGGACQSLNEVTSASSNNSSSSTTSAVHDATQIDER